MRRQPGETFASGWLRPALVCVAALLVVACRTNPSPARVAPTAVPIPSVAVVSATQPQEDQSSVDDAFIAEIRDTVNEMKYLSGAECSRLAGALHDDPSMLPSLRGFASTLRQMGAREATLDTDTVKAALADLDAASSDLDSALARCGIAV